MTEHVQLPQIHLSWFAQTSLVTTWWALLFPTYGTCRAILTTYPSCTFHYRTYLHATNSPHPCQVFLITSLLSLSRMHAMIHITRPTGTTLYQYLILSRGPALTDLSSFTSK